MIFKKIILSAVIMILIGNSIVAQNSNATEIKPINDLKSAEALGKKSIADALFQMRILSYTAQKVYTEKRKHIEFSSSISAIALLCKEEIADYEFGDIEANMGWLSYYKFEGINSNGNLIYTAHLDKYSTIKAFRYTINVVERNNRYCIVPYNIRKSGPFTWFDPYMKEEEL